MVIKRILWKKKHYVICLKGKQTNPPYLFFISMLFLGKKTYSKLNKDLGYSVILKKHEKNLQFDLKINQNVYSKCSKPFLSSIKKKSVPSTSINPILFHTCSSWFFLPFTTLKVVYSKHLYEYCSLCYKAFSELD